MHRLTTSLFIQILTHVCYRQLCLLLDPKDIYCAFAEILLQEEDLKFATTMVKNLNMILMTAVELFKLRNELRDLKTKVSCNSLTVQDSVSVTKGVSLLWQDSVDLFCTLYHSWSHNPVATVSVCFLTQTYKHACNLICKLYGIPPRRLVCI